MNIRSLHVPITAAALAVLLTACGGGGGGGTEGKAVSASPNAPGSSSPAGTTAGSPTSDAAAGTGTSTGNGTGSSTAGGTGTTAGADTTGGANSETIDGGTNANGNTVTPVAPTVPPTPQRPVAAFSDEGIRGDVLLTMLDQRTCNNYGVRSTAMDGEPVPGALDDTPEIVLETLLNLPGNTETGSNYVRRPGATGTPGLGAGVLCRPDQMYAPAKPGTTYALAQNTNPVYRFTPESAKRGFHYFGAEMSLRVSDQSFTLGRGLALTETQDLGKAWEAAHPESLNESPKVHKLNLNAAEDLTIANDSLVKWGVLQEWKRDGQPVYQIMVLRGSAPQQARLCWNASMEYVKRLHCTEWTIPASFKRGDELKVAQSLQDDRSTYTEHESGSLYWRATSN